MKEKKRIIISTSLISIGLLILFSILHWHDSKILTLDSKWVIVSSIPILIGLFLSGIIKSFKGFGVELEANLSQKINYEIIGKVESTPLPEITKQSLGYIFNMSSIEKSKVERVQFTLGKRNYYDLSVIDRYFEQLTNLKFIEITDDRGKFNSLIKASNFENSRGRRIEDLVRGIEEKDIARYFNDIITETINTNNSLLESYKKFNNTSQGKLKNGDQILPVVDLEDKMIGITSKYKLAEKITDQVIKSEK